MLIFSPLGAAPLKEAADIHDFLDRGNLLERPGQRQGLPVQLDIDRPVFIDKEPLTGPPALIAVSASAGRAAPGAERRSRRCCVENRSAPKWWRPCAAPPC